MAEPTFVGAGTRAYSNTNGGTLTPAMPSGYAADDIVVLVAHRGDNTAMDALTGWTQIPSLSGNNTSLQRVEVWWKRIIVGDLAPVVTFGSGTIIRGCQIYGFRGCPTTGDPFSAYARSDNAASTTVNFGSLTPPDPETRLLAVYAYEDDASAASQMSGWGTFTVTTSSSGVGMALGHAHRTWPTASTSTGALSTTVSGGSFANSPSVGLLFALKSATAPSDVTATAAGTVSLSTGTVRAAATKSASATVSTSVGTVRAATHKTASATVTLSVGTVVARPHKTAAATISLSLSPTAGTAGLGTTSATVTLSVGVVRATVPRTAAATITVSPGAAVSRVPQTAPVTLTVSVGSVLARVTQPAFAAITVSVGSVVATTPLIATAASTITVGFVATGEGVDYGTAAATITVSTGGGDGSIPTTGAGGDGVTAATFSASSAPASIGLTASVVAISTGGGEASARITIATGEGDSLPTTGAEGSGVTAEIASGVFTRDALPATITLTPTVAGSTVGVGLASAVLRVMAGAGDDNIPTTGAGDSGVEAVLTSGSSAPATITVAVESVLAHVPTTTEATITVSGEAVALGSLTGQTTATVSISTAVGVATATQTAVPATVSIGVQPIQANSFSGAGVVPIVLFTSDVTALVTNYGNTSGTISLVFGPVTTEGAQTGTTSSLISVTMQPAVEVLFTSTATALISVGVEPVERTLVFVGTTAINILLSGTVGVQVSGVATALIRILSVVVGGVLMDRDIIYTHLTRSSVGEEYETHVTPVAYEYANPAQKKTVEYQHTPVRRGSS